MGTVTTTPKFGRFRCRIDGQAAGPLVSDAQLAALTLEYGGVLHTTGRDFARFPASAGQTRSAKVAQ